MMVSDGKANNGEYKRGKKDGIIIAKWEIYQKFCNPERKAFGFAFAVSADGVKFLYNIQTKAELQHIIKDIIYGVERGMGE